MPRPARPRTTPPRASRSLPWRRIVAGLVAGLGAATAWPGHAVAQPQPTGPMTGGEEEAKPKGIAEAAPKPTGLMATTLTLPPPRDRRKKFEVITLDGYMRARGDWLKNLNLGFNDSEDLGGAPYPQALSCEFGFDESVCSDTVKSSNLRLRLEPTIQLSETVSVHTQIDLLDNLVLGSSPAAGAGGSGLGAFSGGQGTPEDASGGLAQSIAVRRAWAEVSTALGFIKFGRMPDHFGLGIVANSGRRADTDYATWETLWRPAGLANVGGDNPVGYDLDSDHGDTVDRIMFSTSVPGTDLEAAAALDWPTAGLTSDDTDRNPNRAGQPFDLDDADDGSQWMVAVARMDAPRDFQDKVERGKLGLNFGARLIKRTQSWEYEKPFTTGEAPDNDGLVPRSLSVYAPDLWLKLGYKKWTVELEVAGAVGSMRGQADFNTNPVTTGTELDIRTWGGVLRASTLAFEDKLRWGVELGAASGDQWDAAVEGRTHLDSAQLLPPRGQTGDLRRFVFDPDYEIDLILFRELIGAVSNAAYIRPHVSYKLTSAITARVQNVTSAAIESVATPGNGGLWGTEFDLDLSYQANGFTLGGAYGVLFPLSAMDHPSITDDQGGFIFSGANLGDATNAHTIQLRLSVEF